MAPVGFYDLSVCAPSFAFMEFCCGVVTDGVSKVVVDASRMKWEYAECGEERVKSIFPGTCELFGVDLEFGRLNGREALAPGCLPDVWINAYKKHGRIAKMKTLLPAGRERFTVTLRDMDMQTFRNSDEEAWRRFAKEIGAFVVEDYRVKPIGLKERMALYAGAEMNYFVVNGPMHLCIFSDYPYAIFMKAAKKEKMKRAGWPVGGQLWFANEKQRCFWQDDTFENLMKAHESLCGSARSI